MDITRMLAELRQDENRWRRRSSRWSDWCSGVERGAGVLLPGWQRQRNEGAPQGARTNRKLHNVATRGLMLLGIIDAPVKPLCWILRKATATKLTSMRMPLL